MPGGPSRRRVLAALVLAPVALSPLAAGCAAVGIDDGPDPLIALADAARADAELAAAVVAADPDLAARVDPLQAARTAHAAALDAEVARLAGDPEPGSAAAAPVRRSPADTDLAALQAAVTASAQAAAAAVLDLPAERVGLVASISACCATYGGAGVSSTIDEDAIDALQSALAAEHAALWCYGLAVAFLGPQNRAQARDAAAEHRRLRAAVETTLSQLGARAVSAQPSYATPEPVVDAASAAALAVVAETDALGAWRSVLERTEDRPLRTAALDALTKGTLRCARWRVVVGSPPAIPDFPGL